MAESLPNPKFLVSFSSAEKVTSVCVASREEVTVAIDSEQWLLSQDEEQVSGRSTSLVPMIKDVMEQASIDETMVEAIALTHGPGRFTGLRVAVVTARMLCYAWNLPVIALNSLEVVADKLRRERSLPAGSKIWAITDAQRRQVFAAQFQVDDSEILKVGHAQSLFERDAIVELIEKGDHVTGSGTRAFEDQLVSKSEIELPDPSVAMCDAAGVAVLARRRLQSADFDDPLKIEPIYFRPSAAEEVRLAKET